MTLIVLAFLGGVLTIVSPCILPVLPFVFARAGQPFLRSGLPMLVGMAAAFTLVATLAAVAGGWAVEANQWGRIAALTLVAAFGLTLLFPSLADYAARPLVALGSRMSQSADQSAETGGGSIWPSLVIGLATGLAWAPARGPCARPHSHRRGAASARAPRPRSCCSPMRRARRPRWRSRCSSADKSLR